MTDVGNQIPWIGSFPRHWKVIRAKYLFEQMSRPPQDDEGVVTAFRDGEVTLRSNRRTEGFTFANKEIGYQGVRPGDLVIHSMDAFAGAIGVSDSSGKCSPVYSVCQPADGIEPRYYSALLRHMSKVGYIEALSRGIRERSTDFRFSQFAELPLPVPPVATQQAIANFLDEKTAAIDDLIAKKERLIELLEEKRAALINRAVTKGLDPDVPMKDSGIPWIGEIPQHWDIGRTKHLTSRITSGSRGWSDFFSEQGALFFLSGNIGDALALDFSQTQRVTPPKDAEGLRTRVHKGDIVTCITGAKTGAVGLIDRDLGEAYVNQHVALVTPKPPRVDSRFLGLVMWSRVGQTHFAQSQYGGTKQGLGLEDVGNCPIPLAPVEEQRRIANTIAAKISHIHTGEVQISHQIVKLKEYRQSLITAAVTGELTTEDASKPAHIRSRRLREG